MEPLLRRAHAIAKRTGSDTNNTSLVADGEKADGFTLLKREINQLITKARNDCKARDDFRDGVGTKDQKSELVRQTASLQSMISELRQKSTNLREVLSNDKKKSKTPDTDMFQNREKICNLIDAHIDEVEKWVKGSQFVSPKNDPSKKALLKGAKADITVSPMKIDYKPSPTETELEDIDGIDEWRAQVQENEQAIDGKLDLVLEGSYRVRNLANTLSEEYKVFGTMLDDVEKKMDHANDTVVNGTQRAKETLEKVTGGHCCLDLFLIIVILACLYFIIQKYI